MDPKTFFYSPVTSPYITQCAFLSRLPGGGLALTIVGIRDEEGKFRAGVKTRDFGATISSDYLPVGYNFEGVKPSFIIPGKFGVTKWRTSWPERWEPLLRVRL